MKESFTVNKPHMAEDFAELLMTECSETETEVTFQKVHLNDCLAGLARDIVARERHNYDRFV